VAILVDILMRRARIIALASLSQALMMMRWSRRCNLMRILFDAMLFLFLLLNQFRQWHRDKNDRMNR
jgi:hypothetical protein